MTRAVAGVLLALALVLVTGCAPEGDRTVGVPTGEPGALPIEQVSAAPVVRLAEGLAPPTSTWFSSLTFSADPQPVYPYPLAFGPRLDGFTVQLPPVTTSATNVSAALSGGLTIGLAATTFTVVAYDRVSVTLQYADADGPLADVTIAEGAASVGLRALRETVLSAGSALEGRGDGVWVSTVDGVEYGILSPDGSARGSALTVPEGGTAQVFAIPEGGSVDAWVAALGAPITGVTAMADGASTRLTYDGTDRAVLVPFAGHDSCAPEPALGTFTTPYGAAEACVATALEWSVPKVDAVAGYDLTGLDAARRDAVVAQLAVDIGEIGPAPADTYFGGKALARTAAMVELAVALDEPDLSELAADALAAQLAPWLDTSACETSAERCFVYDDRLQLVVGKPAAFGAEDGNDHHFHYGYFLSAAAALGSYRPDTVAELRPVMDALASDMTRVFDPYRGHSWAAGLAPFSDGNNQESSSEAVAAWNGLALWAGVTGDEALAAEATWRLSAEADAATRLWLEPEDLPAEYAHAIVSLTWSDKRDYATWFSAEPSAILGIQLLPLGPVSLSYLADDPERIAANVADAGSAASFAGPLGDSVALYSALAGPEALAAAEAWAASDPTLDDGTSPSAVLAWLAAVSLRG